MESNDDKEEDFPTAQLGNPLWSEDPIPNRQQLYIHQILHHSIIDHTPRPANPPPHPIQEILPESEPMDIKILDDLPDVIIVPPKKFL